MQESAVANIGGGCRSPAVTHPHVVQVSVHHCINATVRDGVQLVTRRVAGALIHTQAISSLEEQICHGAETITVIAGTG